MIKNPGDATRYLEDFQRDKNMTQSEFEGKIHDYFYNSQNSELRDIYTFILNYVVSRITKNYHWLFFTFAMIFGFFYVKSMKFIIPFRDEKHSKWLYPVLFFFFCFSNPIFNINGVRFWTAGWISVYVSFQVLLRNNYKYLLLTPIVIFIHAGLIVYFAIVGLYLSVCKWTKWRKVVFILSIILTASTFVSILDSFSSNLPSSLQHFVTFYASAEAILEKNLNSESLSTTIIIQKNLPRVIVNLLVVLMLFTKNDILANATKQKVFRFLLASIMVVNFTYSIPSVGARFFFLSLPFLVYLLVHSPQFTNKYKYIIYFFPFAFYYYIKYWIINVNNVSEIFAFVLPFPLIILNYI